MRVGTNVACRFMSAPRRLPWMFDRYGEGTVRGRPYLPDVGWVGAYPTFVGSVTPIADSGVTCGALSVTPTPRQPSKKHETESFQKNERETSVAVRGEL